MARVLLTGATGFVGGRVAARLAQRGDEVIALVRTPSQVLDAIGVVQRRVGLDALTAEDLEGADAVVHAAAAVGPDLAAARAVNRDGTQRIAAAARVAGSHLVHVSTTSVYDREAAGDAELDEDAALATAGDPYSVTKAEAEAEVVAARSDGASATILRPPAVLGAGPTSTWGTTIPQRVRDGKAPPWHREQTFGWVHVEDLVDAVLAALDTRSAATVNVVGGHVTLGDYLDAVVALLPGTVPPLPQPDAAPWRGTYAADRLPAELGVTPTRTFAAALDEIAVSWAARDAV
jgi:nucleoside-diphosphate-sugar epimerase